MQIEFWQLIGVAGTVIAAFAGLIKWMFEQFKSGLTEKFTNMHNSLEQVNKESKEWMRVERELLELKADIPLHYVRREDYVRNQTVIEAKLDALAMKFENNELKRSRNER